ncbi:hypothetical protein QUF88_19520 [Bacillus sp. DX1.1]|uniref:hypothetical protein n=1 Tax=unclassified Bacillus (in: firmicutes) TaxID=185979 RepID=UPI002570365B|nr:MULTISPECIES: hypothetical protein [unclassified Bacillus (in: firmicutes)]MDM5155902.1 hypothetical protein [Bacillus sp. DX1.1]WJE80196.1 hypothetical protein QRE67_17050 [Bacillus sp. DX3.1]
MIQKEGGVMVEEYVLDLYNVLYTTDWQDIVSFLGILFCMKLVIVYMEEQGVFFFSTSPSDLQRESLLNDANLKYTALPLVSFFIIRFIAAIVKKKEGEEDCYPTCKSAYYL